MILIVDFIHIANMKRKTTNIFSGLIKKSKKQFLQKSAVFKIFNEIFLDKSDQPILDLKRIKDLIVK